jgi:hypothetical protein
LSFGTALIQRAFSPGGVGSEDWATGIWHRFAQNENFLLSMYTLSMYNHIHTRWSRKWIQSALLTLADDFIRQARSSLNQRTETLSKPRTARLLTSEL